MSRERGEGWFLAVLGLLMAFASISTDLYLPAMPTMAQDLRMTQGFAALTVTLYLLGFSVGQLAWGPLSDRYGRRRPIIAGLCVFVAGSAGCAFATSGAVMVGARAVQAIGACACVVIARAMVRDRFEGAHGARVMSTLMTVMAVAPLLGPSVGSAILAATGSWRVIFGALVGIGVVTMGATWSLPETWPAERRTTGGMAAAVRVYGVLIGQPRLLALAGVLGFFYAATFAYIAASPFVFITYFHLSASTYAVIFAAGVFALMMANLTNRHLVQAWSTTSLLRYGAWGAGASVLLMLSGHLLQLGSPWAVIMPAVVFVASTGFIVANAVTAALATVPKSAGAASALLGAIQYGGGILGSAAVGSLTDGTPMAMIVTMLVASSGVVACAYVADRSFLPRVTKGIHHETQGR